MAKRTCHTFSYPIDTRYGGSGWLRGLEGMDVLACGGFVQLTRLGGKGFPTNGGSLRLTGHGR